MSDLFNYLSQTVQTAFQHSNFVSEKIYILAVIFAWGDALTSVGTAFMSKMIPLRGMAVLNNIFGWSSGLLSGSTATFVKHSINFPLNISRWRQMRQLIDKVKNRRRQRSECRLAEALHAHKKNEGGRAIIFARGRRRRGVCHYLG